MVVFYEVFEEIQEVASFCPGPGPDCASCEDKVICHCLQIRESTLVDAVDSRQMMTVNDIVRETGAGGGCTACHRRLRRFLKTTI